MSDASSATELTVVGIPTNRRVTLLVTAAAGVGLRTRVLAWREVVDGSVPDRLGLVRVDSPGEDAEVDAGLRRLGGGDDRILDHGEIGDLAAWYAGLVRALGRLLAVPGASLDNSVDDVAALFDKRVTRQRLTAAGVRVPSAGPDAERLLDAPGRWFVKLAHGSSASGVLAIEIGRGRFRAVGPVERVGRRLFNTMKLQTCTTRPGSRP